jgi:hypothetical protein
VKKTDLEKNKALKLANSLKLASALRSPADNAPKVDRREQRRLDQSQGLVPFACKLNQDLVEQLKTRAAAHPGGINAVVGELLNQALAQAGA